MSATAATIRVALEAQTAALRKDLLQGRQAIQNLGNSMSGQVAAGLAKFTVGLAGVTAGLLSLRSLAGQVSTALGDIDATAKFANRIGIAADQLTILNFAAEQTGASAQTMQMALQRMTRRISEASTGSGEAVGALNELGLSAEYLASLSPDQQFGAIADAMKNVSGQGDKVRLAMKLFDSEGVALVNTLKGGSAGLNEFGQQAERAGMLLGDNRETVQAANDAINRMKHAWGGVIQRVAILVAPWLEKLAGIVERVVAGFSKLFGISGKAADFGATAKKAAAAFVPPIDKAAEAAAKKAKEALARAAEDIKRRGEVVAKAVRTPFEIYADQAADLKQLLSKGAISWQTYGRAIKKAGDDLASSRLSEILDAQQTPGIGAVTRRSAAGFSAVQEAQRDRADRERQHRELLAALSEIRAAVKDSAIVIEPRRI